MQARDRLLAGVSVVSLLIGAAIYRAFGGESGLGYYVAGVIVFAVLVGIPLAIWAAARGVGVGARALSREIALGKEEAKGEAIRERITHNRSGDIIDTYTSFEWEPLCEAMLCFRVDFRCDEVISVRISASSEEESIVEDRSESVARFVANDSFTIRKAGENSGGGGNRTLLSVIR